MDFQVHLKQTLSVPTAQVIWTRVSFWWRLDKADESFKFYKSADLRINPGFKKRPDF